MDSEGYLVVIELKRDKTPRDVVAQTLDYGSWVQGLSYDDIARIFGENHSGSAFESAYEETFGGAPPEVLNAGHRLVIVAARLDAETERIISYLTDNYGVPINAVFFHFFKEGETPLLARTWLLDPHATETQAPKKTSKGKASETWNGKDFYVNVMQDDYRHWEDCRRYGFIAAGGGRWYSRSLQLLFKGARVFAYLPASDGFDSGYAGVGIVEGDAIPATQWKAERAEGKIPLLELPLDAPNMGHDADDPDDCEYVVPVRWIHTLGREQTYREKGMFANQNSVCRLTNAFTLDKLVRHFALSDSNEDM